MDYKIIANKLIDEQLFGTFIEVGAGNPIYNTLCAYPNTASKLVKYAESPCNFEYAKDLYNLNDRAVSYQTCREFMCTFTSTNETKSFVLANSVQIANDVKTNSHGWFGLNYNGVNKYIHYTIPNGYSRLDQINFIKDVGFDILNSMITGNFTHPFIDIIRNDTKHLLDELIDSYVNITVKYDYEKVILINKDGEAIRLSEYIRNNKEITIFKGSFNPIHRMHEKMALHVTDKPLFSISISNFDVSKQIDKENLLKRIKMINALGYSVLLTEDPLIIHTCNTIKNNLEYYLNKNKINFILGADVYEKFIDCELKLFLPSKKKSKIQKIFNRRWKKVNFHVFNRDNTVQNKYKLDNINIHNEFDTNIISSTYIRMHLKYLSILRNDIKDEKMLDDEYIEFLNNNYVNK